MVHSRSAAGGILSKLENILTQRKLAKPAKVILHCLWALDLRPALIFLLCRQFISVLCLIIVYSLSLKFKYFLRFCIGIELFTFLVSDEPLIFFYWNLDTESSYSSFHGTPSLFGRTLLLLYLFIPFYFHIQPTHLSFSFPLATILRC